MSIIIKGIDLPKEGEEHRIIIHHNGQVIIDKRTYYEEAEAIQIPTPHGRIIDGDALDQYIESKGFVIGYKAINDQKVILEAEE